MFDFPVFIKFGIIKNLPVLGNRNDEMNYKHLTSHSSTLLKGYLRYKTVLCHKVALDVQLMNFFI